ncbi:UNVERIFIED_CONTAM: hypothetical protein Scaly_2598000 [Sesamum calycinum]|uniref:CCHC-type domain-containing protein n=1 Tax=Sesamum calycinum TaxID=2727403 RepID=A0AAW2JFE0_9LAMI
MHQVQPSSNVNYVSEKNKNINPNGVGKKIKSFDSDSNKRHVTCYNCGKKGHIKKDCHFRKEQKTFEMPNVQVVETNVEEVIAMVSNLHIEIRKNLVSAAILSKKGLKTVIEADKLIVTKNGEFVGKGYYCDGMFKLLEGDPKTFTEAMTSRDAVFWKEAVNDEMDSLLANNPCVLTDLPPGSKAIGLSRFTSNPTIEHWKGIRRVFGYLKGTANLGLFYNRFPAVLEGYSDASWITSIGNNKSTSGWIFTLAGGAVAWASKKQTCLTHSTMEAEFVALAATSKEAEWLR